jgi:hypothetical protein
MTTTPEIRIPVPPRVYAKLTEVARSYGSVERWAQDALARAAEEAQPALKDSGLWRTHMSDWSALVSKQEFEDEACDLAERQERAW